MNKKKIIIISVVIAILLVIGIVLGVVLSGKDDPAPSGGKFIAGHLVVNGVRKNNSDDVVYKSAELENNLIPMDAHNGGLGFNFNSAYANNGSKKLKQMRFKILIEKDCEIYLSIWAGPIKNNGMSQKINLKANEEMTIDFYFDDVLNQGSGIYGMSLDLLEKDEKYWTTKWTIKDLEYIIEDMA